jgi:hypothetical protein
MAKRHRCPSDVGISKQHEPAQWQPGVGAGVSLGEEPGSFWRAGTGGYAWARGGVLRAVGAKGTGRAGRTRLVA